MAPHLSHEQSKIDSVFDRDSSEAISVLSEGAGDQPGTQTPRGVGIVHGTSAEVVMAAKADVPSAAKRWSVR
jgi:hypothetical protein